ncbi:unannotated protein [freshwater metagenome]|uniref:Unannotated protein n=1 Tax=freshwater metagenome TaxID=449393 RepID=A0A6J6X0C4_9ZZZZ
MIGATFTDPLLFDYFIKQVGDANLTGPSGIQSRLNGPTNVVGVDVAVVETLATHNHDGVTNTGPHFLEGRHLGVLGVEEIHDFVAQVGNAALAVLLARLLGVHLDGVEFGGNRQRVTSDDVTKGVEQQEQSSAAGVNDAGLLENGKLFGGVGQCGSRRSASRANHVLQRSRGTRRTNGSGASHRQDGALDRTDYGLAGQNVSVRQRVGQGRGLDGVAVTQLLHEPSEQLRQDDPGVTAGTHERSVRNGLTDGQHVGAGGHLGQLGHHRLNGEGHIRASVAVGDGVDI